MPSEWKEGKMEEEMQQLLSMGFPDKLAARALAATGGDSAVRATEWILSQCDKDDQDSDSGLSNLLISVSNPPSIPPFQPKIDRFFQFQAKALAHSEASSTKKEKPADQRQDDDDEERRSLSRTRKRPKELHPSLIGPSTSNSRSSTSEDKPAHEPLSERMRPRTIDEVVGQEHLLANHSLLRSAIDCNRLPSLVFWGPPGTGKTSIARAIVNSSAPASSYRFVSLSAVTAGVKDVREAVDDARRLKSKNNKRTVLFIDEVHRFNKSQQDCFLPVIEDGSVVFMGATTENPSFHLITPLLSRCRVLTLNPLKPHHVAMILKRAAADSVKGLVRSIAKAPSRISTFEVSSEAIDFLSTHCDGDARVALNALEISATTAVTRLSVETPLTNCPAVEGDDVVDFDTGRNESMGFEGDGINSFFVTITLDDAKEALQSKHLVYDKAGDEHYNIISALHKSMRGSDADASIYWLARMLEGGEEPLYIARRLIRFASEDIGLADPSALTQAVACYQACHFIGMPECNVNLAQCVAYLALAPKSVSVYQAIQAAQKVVKESVGQNEGVPLHLRNAPTKLMKELGYGKGYIYPPDNPSSSSQSYMPPSLEGYKFLFLPKTGDATDQ